MILGILLSHKPCKTKKTCMLQPNMSKLKAENAQKLKKETKKTVKKILDLL